MRIIGRDIEAEVAAEGVTTKVYLFFAEVADDAQYILYMIFNGIAECRLIAEAIAPEIETYHPVVRIKASGDKAIEGVRIGCKPMKEQQYGIIRLMIDIMKVNIVYRYGMVNCAH